MLMGTTYSPRAPPKLMEIRLSRVIMFFSSSGVYGFLIDTRVPATSEYETTANKIHHSHFAISHKFHTAVRRPPQQHTGHSFAAIFASHPLTDVRPHNFPIIYFILRAHQRQIAPPLFSPGPSFCTSLS